MKNKISKMLIGAIVAVAVGVAGVIGVLGGMAITPDQSTCPAIQEVIDVTPFAQADIDAAVAAVEPVVEFVEVDNGNLNIVLQEIYDNNGAVSYLTDNLNDDEVAEIADRVIMANNFKTLAAAEVKSEGTDELDKEVSNTNVTLDEDDIERFKVYDDADEISIDSIDYEDGDATLYVEAKLEQDEVVFDVVFKIKIRDNEVDRISVDSVIERV